MSVTPSPVVPCPVVRTTAGDLAGRILASADAAIAARGRFVVALAGGTTPHPVYRAVETLGSGRPGGYGTAWTVLLTDERCLPAGHPDRNDTAIAASLPTLARAGRIRAIPAELGSHAAAEGYAGTVTDVGRLDLVVAGLGADGHTASIFPAAEVGSDAPAVCRPVEDAPPPFTQRVTLDLAVLAAARQGFIVVDGTDRTKEAAVADLQQGVGPAAVLTRTGRTSVVLLQPGSSGGGRLDDEAGAP